MSPFPKISVLKDSTMVNGQLLTHSRMPFASVTGPRGRSGQDGVTTNTSNVVVYETTSPTSMSANIETVDL